MPLRDVPGVEINYVRDLLPFLQGVPVTYRFKKHDVELEGFVTAGGYVCACAAAASCGYHRKVLSALQFEKHAGAVSKNQNGHIFLRNGKSLYELFHMLRSVPTEVFPEEFRAAAGVPMTVCAVGASLGLQGAGQGQQPGGMASWELNGVQIDGVMAEPPSALAQEDVDTLTEEKAGLCLLGLSRESGSATSSNPSCGAQGSATGDTEDEAGGDHAMPDVDEARDWADENDGFSSLLAATHQNVQVVETRHQLERTTYQLESYLKDVRGLLSTGLLEGFKVIYKKDEVENVGRISGQGYSCGCSQCGYSSQILNACEFEQHSGESSNNQNDHIFLETGISLYRVLKALKHYKLNALGESIEEIIGLPPNMVEYSKWKDLFQKKKDDLDTVASDHCSTQSSGSTIGEKSLADHLKKSASSSISNLNRRAFKRRSERHFKREGTETSTPSPDHSVGSESKEQKTRYATLHALLFKEDGLPDNTLLTYKLKNGKVLKQGYKLGTCIICNCCNKEFTPSHFEDHAGMGRRRQPYHNICISEGLTLHKLAFQLQDHLNSNRFGMAKMSVLDDYPSLTSPDFGHESCTPSGPIAPLKRTLQERMVGTEICYFCGDDRTTIGKIDAEMIVFCNQCERPCHVKCYNSRLEKKKSPLKVLEEYMHFCFLCCEKCQLLRARLDDGLEKCEKIAFLRHVRSNICWRLLSGMNVSNDVRYYLPQVIDIFKDAFSETTAEHIDVIEEMVNAKDADRERDFRGMYCAALTISTHVVSAAILKVRTEEVAELVLIATRCECRKKGYFVLLLKSIETYLRSCNVNLLMVPVDHEMAPIWSEKLGFTILSPEDKKSMLEAHPLVMFENLILVQKSLT